MRCCIDCFDDQEIEGFFRSNSTEIGQCDFCGTNGSNLLDPREFEEKFLPLIQSYTIVSEKNREDIQPALLHEKLQLEWGIFSEKITNDARLELIKEILSDSYDKNDPLLNNEVERKVVLLNLEEAQLLEEEWEHFAKEIKSNNRYFLGKNIDLKLLAELFAFHSNTYQKGKFFYRGRVSTKDGYKLKKMGKPPASSSTSGRANPIGIPYLYVSTTHETVLRECRATYLDYVSIAEFKLKDQIRVVSLRHIENISPFLFEDWLENYLKYQKYLKRLEIELSKPLRKHDHILEYLPTQYLCEYVKYLGYDAIEYGSAMHNGGINLAIFNDEKLEPKKVEVFEIVSMNLETEQIV